MPEKKKFNPASLSKEDQEAVIEHYLGIHPRYFVYRGTIIIADVFNSRRAGKNFNGFKPDLESRLVRQ